MSGGELDRVLGFLVPDRNARGRVVRLGPAMEAVLANHAYPPAIRKLLEEALILAALLGSLLKGEGSQLTMQAQTEAGIIELLVADFQDGAVRGYVQYDAERFAECSSNPSLFSLFGKGYLAITFDQQLTGERYQGIVPLEGEGLADAVEHYFFQSEQVPSLIRVGLSDDGTIAGGIIVQHLPEGEEGRERLHVRHDHPEWEHVRILASTIKREELTDSDLPLETVIWRLFNEESEVRVLGGAAITKGCRCNPEKIRSVIAQFPESDRAEMADESGVISVDCRFCATAFPLNLAEFVD